MRVEYQFGLKEVDRPRFSVEATEGPAKLFTLATLVLNVLHQQPRVDVVFHSPNSQDLTRKVERVKVILGSAPDAPSLQYEDGKSGDIGGIYFRWLSILATDGLSGG
jgi:hypothetical protein